MRKCISLFVAAVAVFSIASSTDALTIDSNDVVIFSDDFETYSGFRTDPCTPPWTLYSNNQWEGDTIWVETSAGAVPAPGQGTCYLLVGGFQADGGYAVVGEAWNEFGNLSTGSLRAKFAVYDVIGIRGLGMFVRWNPLPASEAAWPPVAAVRSNNHNLEYYNYTSDSWTDTGLVLNENMWNVVVYELDLELNMASVRLNGEVFAGIPIAPSAEVGAFVIRGDLHSTTGIDAFPAPETCAAVLAQGYYLVGDVDDNCRVDLVDFSLFAGNWMDCIDPCDVDCVLPWVFE